MKRSTVARHLREIADQATRWSQLPTDTFETPRLTEVWVGGDIVDKLGEPDHVVAILRFDAPEEELPEIALTRVERAVSFSFRLDKRPMIVRARPTARPPWSHLERRVARIWSEEDGPEAANLEGLAGPDLSAAEVIAPTEVELRAWLEREIPRSEAHLRSVLDGYWEAPWRREHKGGGVYPEDHLWRAAWAVQSMRDALVELA